MVKIGLFGGGLFNNARKTSLFNQNRNENLFQRQKRQRKEAEFKKLEEEAKKKGISVGLLLFVKKHPKYKGYLNTALRLRNYAYMKVPKAWTHGAAVEEAHFEFYDSHGHFLGRLSLTGLKEHPEYAEMLHAVSPKLYERIKKDITGYLHERVSTFSKMQANTKIAKEVIAKAKEEGKPMSFKEEQQLMQKLAKNTSKNTNIAQNLYLKEKYMNKYKSKPHVEATVEITEYTYNKPERKTISPEQKINIVKNTLKKKGYLVIGGRSVRNDKEGNYEEIKAMKGLTTYSVRLYPNGKITSTNVETNKEDLNLQELFNNLQTQEIGEEITTKLKEAGDTQTQVGVGVSELKVVKEDKTDEKGNALEQIKKDTEKYKQLAQQEKPYLFGHEGITKWFYSGEATLQKMTNELAKAGHNINKGISFIEDKTNVDLPIVGTIHGKEKQEEAKFIDEKLKLIDKELEYKSLYEARKNVNEIFWNNKENPIKRMGKFVETPVGFIATTGAMEGVIAKAGEGLSNAKLLKTIKVNPEGSGAFITEERINTIKEIGSKAITVGKTNTEAFLTGGIGMVGLEEAGKTIATPSYTPLQDKEAVKREFISGGLAGVVMEASVPITKSMYEVYPHATNLEYSIKRLAASGTAGFNMGYTYGGAKYILEHKGIKDSNEFFNQSFETGVGFGLFGMGAEGMSIMIDKGLIPTVEIGKGKYKKITDNLKEKGYYTEEEKGYITVGIRRGMKSKSILSFNFEKPRIEYTPEIKVKLPKVKIKETTLAKLKLKKEIKLNLKEKPIPLEVLEEPTIKLAGENEEFYYTNTKVEKIRKNAKLKATAKIGDRYIFNFRQRYTDRLDNEIIPSNIESNIPLEKTMKGNMKIKIDNSRIFRLKGYKVNFKAPKIKLGKLTVETGIAIGKPKIDVSRGLFEFEQPLNPTDVDVLKNPIEKYAERLQKKDFTIYEKQILNEKFESWKGKENIPEEYKKIKWKSFFKSIDKIAKNLYKMDEPQIKYSLEEVLGKSDLFKKEGAVRDIIEVLKKEKGGVVVFGSMPQKMYIGEYMRRNPQDIDLITFGKTTSSEMAKKIVDKLKTKYKDNIRISPERESLVEIKHEGKWVHAFDIHEFGEHIDMTETSKELNDYWVGYGYRTKNPVNIKGGFKIISFGEQTVRKAAGSTLTPRFFGFAPESHRLKDVGDTISLAEFGAEELKLKGLKTQLERLKKSIPEEVLVEFGKEPVIIIPKTPPEYTYAEGYILPSKYGFTVVSKEQLKKNSNKNKEYSLKEGYSIKPIAEYSYGYKNTEKYAYKNDYPYKKEYNYNYNYPYKYNYKYNLPYKYNYEYKYDYNYPYKYSYPYKYDYKYNYDYNYAYNYPYKYDYKYNYNYQNKFRNVFSPVILPNIKIGKLPKMKTGAGKGISFKPDITGILLGKGTKSLTGLGIRGYKTKKLKKKTKKKTKRKKTKKKKKGVNMFGFS